MTGGDNENPFEEPMSTGPSQDEQGAPRGISLADYARVSAEIAEGDATIAEILEGHGLTGVEWNDATIYWMMRMGEDVREHGERARMPLVYSDAFTTAQDALKAVPPSDAASYAKLLVDVQLAGGPAEPLALRGLSTADYLRISRRWARVLATDGAQARAFFDAYQALQPEAVAPAHDGARRAGA